MCDYRQEREEEQAYLSRTVEFIRQELQRLQELLSARKKALAASGKAMWEESNHYSTDFEKMTEVSQHLAMVGGQSINYNSAILQVEKYSKALQNPYFGRFDFTEEGSSEREALYIGLQTVMNEKTRDVLVYDWRAPVSGIFYQYELGKAGYLAPFGYIAGEVSLKRQYKIQGSALQYFFDCTMKIDDEMLQEVLARNSSPKMRTIVETIQREQDIMIRDLDHDLLMVQGVAGSGKTSVALHRIAYLLYQGHNAKLNCRDILILSPNQVFSRYISDVLPELGEENVSEMVLEDYLLEVLSEKGSLETRSRQLDSLLQSNSTQEEKIMEQHMAFKGSREFIKLLDRLIDYYEHREIEFEDVYFHGRLIESRQQLRNQFFRDPLHLPAAKRLQRMENVILDRIHPLQIGRREWIESRVQKMDGHELEIKPFSRLLSIKDSKALQARLRKFTSVDFFQVYRRLFDKKGLFDRLAKGLSLPERVEEMRVKTRSALAEGRIRYEDSGPLLYLKLRMEGSDRFSGIRQVVVDEAQDYTPVHYAAFRLMFEGAGYTIVGDIQQSIEKEPDASHYDAILDALGKKKAVKLVMNKSYRSSYEICMFSRQFCPSPQEVVPFERHEAPPEVYDADTPEAAVPAVAASINQLASQGFESVALLCKTAAEAKWFHERLQNTCNMQLLEEGNGEMQKGLVVMPVYLAKGLEFDAVVLLDSYRAGGGTELDRRIRYIGCTRALHRLVMYRVGEYR